MASAVYGTEGDHILCCVPTGYGKTMGPLITSLLLPPGKAINKIWKFEAPLDNLIIPRPPSNKSWMNQPSNTVSVWVQALPQVPLQYWWYPWLLLLRRSSKSASDSASELLWEVRSLTIWNYCYFCRKPYSSPSRWHYHYFLQFEPGEFMAELQKQPQLVICSVEFLASREVHW